MSYKKQELLTLRGHLGSPPPPHTPHPGSVLRIFLVLCVEFLFCSVSCAQCCLCLLSSLPILSSVVRVVHLLCVFTFLVPCCDVGYDFRIKTMFDSPVSPVVCRMVHFYCVVCVCFVSKYFVLSYVLRSFRYCDVLYDFRIKNYVCSSLLSIICARADVLFVICV